MNEELLREAFIAADAAHDLFKFVIKSETKAARLRYLGAAVDELALAGRKAQELQESLRSE